MTKSELERLAQDQAGELSRYKAQVEELQARMRTLGGQKVALRDAIAANATLASQLESTKKTSDYLSSKATALEAQIEQVHMFLDNMPGSIPRRQECAYSDTPVFTRLAVMLATRGAV